MAITLEVKVAEKGDPNEGDIEVMGLTRSVITQNANQAAQLIRDDIKRILAGPPEKDE